MRLFILPVEAWYNCSPLHSSIVKFLPKHYGDIIMSTMASQITGVSIVYSTICSDVDQRKHQSSVSLAFLRGINWWPVNSPHKGPVMRKMFSLDDVIMKVPAAHSGPRCEHVNRVLSSFPASKLWKLGILYTVQEFYISQFTQQFHFRQHGSWPLGLTQYI